MNALSIDYKSLSYEALARIIELANKMECTPEEAARRYLLSCAERQNKKEDAA